MICAEHVVQVLIGIHSMIGQMCCMFKVNLCCWVSFVICSVDLSAHICKHTLAPLIFINNKTTAIKNATAYSRVKGAKLG